MFLEKVKKPIVGLAPMDGVTDAVFRYMVCLNSRPSFVMTEFVNVEGLARGAGAFYLDLQAVAGIVEATVLDFEVVVTSLQGNAAGLLHCPPADAGKRTGREVGLGIGDDERGIDLGVAGHCWRHTDHIVRA